MAGRKSLSLDEKIARAQDQVVKDKERYEHSISVLEELMAKKKGSAERRIA